MTPPIPTVREAAVRALKALRRRHPRNYYPNTCEDKEAHEVTNDLEAALANEKEPKVERVVLVERTEDRKGDMNLGIDLGYCFNPGAGWTIIKERPVPAPKPVPIFGCKECGHPHTMDELVPENDEAARLLRTSAKRGGA